MHGVKLRPGRPALLDHRDCGAHVTSKEGKVIDNPDSGPSSRNLDGTGFRALRQRPAQPAVASPSTMWAIFPGDNNADGGDKARWPTSSKARITAGASGGNSCPSSAREFRGHVAS